MCRPCSAADGSNTTRPGCRTSMSALSYVPEPLSNSNCSIAGPESLLFGTCMKM